MAQIANAELKVPFEEGLQHLFKTAPNTFIYNRQVMFTALTKSNVFPTLSIAKCQAIAEKGTIRTLVSSPECTQIIDLFASCGLNATMGFNPGSGLLSLKIPIPLSIQLRKPIKSYRQALLYCALGLLDQQHSLEYDFVHLQRQFYLFQQKSHNFQPFDILDFSSQAGHYPAKPNITSGKGQQGCVETIFNIINTSELLQTITTPAPLTVEQQDPIIRRIIAANGEKTPHHDQDQPRVTPDQLINLANVCLYIFYRQTHCLISDRQLDMNLNTITLVLRPAERAYIMNKIPKSGAPHPLTDLLSYMEVSPEQSALEHNILEQFKKFEEQNAVTQALVRQGEVLQYRQQLQAHLLAMQQYQGTPEYLKNIRDSIYENIPLDKQQPRQFSRELDPQLLVPFSERTQISPSQTAKISPKEEEIIINDELRARFFFSFKIPTYKSDEGALPFTYSPIYSLITAYDPQTGKFEPSYLDRQRRVIVKILQLYFWHYITAVERYYPTAALCAQMNQVLERYFGTGLSTVRCGFNPRVENLSLFLWGTAGTGKSTFVRVLCSTLYIIIDRIFEPSKRVEITRMPLNQTSPEALVALLMVKGISDWSLERIVEQTVSRGGLSLLHLEEQPPEPEIQDKLYSLINKMTRTLVTRYPEYRNNVINLLTANYPPSPDLAKNTNVIEITPPNRKTQQIWISKTTEDMIASNLLPVEAGYSRHVFLGLEKRSLIQFTSHPKDKPPFTITHYTDTYDNGSNKGENYVLKNLSNNSTNNANPTYHNVFHTTIQRPIHSLSVRLSDKDFRMEFLRGFFAKNPSVATLLNIDDTFSSNGEDNVPSIFNERVTGWIDAFSNAVGIGPIYNIENGMTKSKQFSEIDKDTDNLMNELVDTFPYPELLPYLHRYHGKPALDQLTSNNSFFLKSPTTNQLAHLQFNVHIELVSAPPFTFDLRKLEGWKRSVSFSILQHLISHLSITCALCGLISLPSSNSLFLDNLQKNNTSTSDAPVAGQLKSTITTLNDSTTANSAVLTSELDTLKYILPETLISLALSAKIYQKYNPNTKQFTMHVDFDSYDTIGYKRNATMSPVQYKKYLVQKTRQDEARKKLQDFIQNRVKSEGGMRKGYNYREDPQYIKKQQEIHSLVEDNLLSLLPPLQLQSADGYFFHPVVVSKQVIPAQQLIVQNSVQTNQQKAEKAVRNYQSNSIQANTKFTNATVEYRDPALPLTFFERERVNTIISMWKSQFLQPAVIVLAGPPSQTSIVVKYIHNLIQSQCLVPDLNHFPPEHITTKDNSMYPSINTNLQYHNALRILSSKPKRDLQLSNINHYGLYLSGTQPNSDNTSTLKLQPSEDCLISPPFAYDTFLNVIRHGKQYLNLPSPNLEDFTHLAQRQANTVAHNPHSAHTGNPLRRFLPKIYDGLNDEQVLQQVPLLHTFYAIAHDEHHKHSLFGEPDPSASVLNRFITKIQTHHLPKISTIMEDHYGNDSDDEDHDNNPDTNATTHVNNHAPKPPVPPSHMLQTQRLQIQQEQETTVPRALGAIFAATNSAGQFYFRDLIDTGESNTHVTKIQKNGLLFVLVIDNTRDENDKQIAEGDTSGLYAVQPQVISRSHIVINIPNSSVSHEPKAKL